MSGIGPARPEAHQLVNTMNNTPGCYALPAGATMGTHVVRGKHDGQSKEEIKKGLALSKQRKHPAQQAALLAKHGTYLKVQMDAAERRKALLKEKAEKGQSMSALSQFEEESKEHREVFSSLGHGSHFT